jgi:hypothetical protein
MEATMEAAPEVTSPVTPPVERVMVLGGRTFRQSTVTTIDRDAYLSKRFRVSGLAAFSRTFDPATDDLNEFSEKLLWEAFESGRAVRDSCGDADPGRRPMDAQGRGDQCRVLRESHGRRRQTRDRGALRRYPVRFFSARRCLEKDFPEYFGNVGDEPGQQRPDAANAADAADAASANEPHGAPSAALVSSEHP